MSVKQVAVHPKGGQQHSKLDKVIQYSHATTKLIICTIDSSRRKIHYCKSKREKLSIMIYPLQRLYYGAVIK